jgi:DNA-binding response OmpR family regulator
MKAKHRIMIADDDEAILDALSIMLQDAGYEVITIENGQNVLQIKENLPDLLLLDIWMSGIDGGTICKQLKKQKNTKHIPVIMLSANRDIEKIARECGAVDFITKPFEMDHLLQKITEYIK